MGRRALGGRRAADLQRLHRCRQGVLIGIAGFIYPAWCAIYSETAESISPHGVGRAFGITATLAPIAGLFLNLGLPQVVDLWGWSVWMMIAGVCCFFVAALVGVGQGPWWPKTVAP